MGKSKELATFTDAGGTLSGNLTFDSTNPSIVLGADNNQRSYIQRYSDDLYIYNKEAAGDVYLGSANTTRMTIDASGRVTMPYQPAFYVRKSGGSGLSSGVQAWNYTSLNVGSHFNLSLGRFTAPINGKYLFGLMLLNAFAGTNSSYLRKNGSVISDIIYHQHYDGPMSTTVILPLVAGDYVEAWTYRNVYNSNYGDFSGYLIG